MKYKAFFSFIILCTLLASCCKFEVVSPYEEEFVLVRHNAISSAKPNADQFASVRFGMFENIDSYRVKITRIWIDSDESGIILPDFASNIISSEFISSSCSEPTFDLEYGQYTKVLIPETPSQITIHFNALVMLEGESFSIAVEDAVYVIDGSQTSWADGMTYSYLIKVNEELLGLKEISFNPTVSDHETVGTDN